MFFRRTIVGRGSEQISSKDWYAAFEILVGNPGLTGAAGGTPRLDLPMRRFERVEGTSSKFWEVGVEGSALTTRWGRIGTAGQSKAKPFADAAAARKEHDKLVAEKVGKG
jgi:predicted DNA-binding WGR domain protein